MAEPGDLCYVRTKRNEEIVVLEARFVRSLGQGDFALVLVEDGSGGVLAAQVPSISVRSSSLGLATVALPPEWRESLRAEHGVAIRTSDEDLSSTPSNPTPATAGDLSSIQTLLTSMAKSLNAVTREVAELKKERRTPLPRQPTSLAGLERLAAMYGGGGGGGAEDEEDIDEDDLAKDDTGTAGWARAMFSEPGQPKPGSPPGLAVPPSSPPPPVSGPEAASNVADVIKNLVEIQAETVKTLKKIGRRGDDYDTSESETEGERVSGQFAAPRRHQRFLEKHPERVIDRWLAHVRSQCQAYRPGAHWSLGLHSESLRRSFGQNTGMLRVHHHLSAALDVAIFRRQPMIAIAMLVELLKAVHQVGVDSGKWTTASEMVVTPDPLAPIVFAGHPDDMARVMSYQSNVEKLKTQLKPRGPPVRDGAGKGDGGGAAASSGDPGPSKGNRRNPKAAEPER